MASTNSPVKTLGGVVLTEAGEEKVRDPDGIRREVAFVR
jgi:hypothetical protein